MKNAMSLNLSDFDTNKHFVRIIQARPDGFIEFEFAIGEPEVFVELLLNLDDFSDFCATHKVEILPSASAIHDENNEFDWRLSDVQKSFNNNKKS